MADHITTYGGTHFTPTSPDINKIHIKDIAHALSLTCRGNGHVKTFFSFGQHCIHCALEAEARGYSGRVILACLVHDASEAYMSDVPTPFKKYLKEYINMEDHLLNLIYIKFLGSPLTPTEAQLVKQLDSDMLYFDMSILLNETSDSPAPSMKSSFSYEVLPFETVETRFLELYTKYRLI